MLLAEHLCDFQRIGHGRSLFGLIDRILLNDNTVHCYIAISYLFRITIKIILVFVQESDQRIIAI